MDKSTVYNNYQEAFNDMHHHTELNEPFKLTFRKASDASIKIIPKTLLRKQTPTANDKNGAFKFNYIDVINDECGSAYIPLLLAVNDKQIKLK